MSGNINKENIKHIALDQAIRSNSGNSYDDDERHIVDADRVIAAAKKFEAYLKEN